MCRVLSWVILHGYFSTFVLSTQAGVCQTFKSIINRARYPICNIILSRRTASGLVGSNAIGATNAICPNSNAKRWVAIPTNVECDWRGYHSRGRMSSRWDTLEVCSTSSRGYLLVLTWGWLQWWWMSTYLVVSFTRLWAKPRGVIQLFVQISPETS